VTRALACLGLVAATTWAAFSLLRVNSLIAGFAYVLIVLVVAAKWGLAESFLTSVAAMLCLNYFFLPPILSLTIADPQNWVALFVFWRQPSRPVNFLQMLVSALMKRRPDESR